MKTDVDAETSSVRCVSRDVFNIVSMPRTSANTARERYSPKSIQLGTPHTTDRPDERHIKYVAAVRSISRVITAKALL